MGFDSYIFRDTQDVAQLAERVFGEHEAAGAIPAVLTICLVMPSLRGSRHDSAKIVGGGSNPPGGTVHGPTQLGYQI